MNEQNGKHMEEQNANLEAVSLPNDTGGEIVFTGYLVAENRFFDEETQVLTQQRLYATSDGNNAFAIVESGPEGKARRAYMLRREGDLCKVNNGLFDVTFHAKHLMTVVKDLCGLKDEDQYRDVLGAEETSTDAAINEF